MKTTKEVILTEKQLKWLTGHFKNTKNDVIVAKLGISHSKLHRLAREHGLKKTKRFQNACQLAAAKKARDVNKRNNWPPKGYRIPGSKDYTFGGPKRKKLSPAKERLRIQRAQESLRKTRALERARVNFGLEQKTKLRVISVPQRKRAYRYYLKQRGYVVARASRIVYYNQATNRSPVVERTATKRHGFELRPA